MPIVASCFISLAMVVQYGAATAQTAIPPALTGPTAKPSESANTASVPVQKTATSPNTPNATEARQVTEPLSSEKPATANETRAKVASGHSNEAPETAAAPITSSSTNTPAATGAETEAAKPDPVKAVPETDVVTSKPPAKKRLVVSSWSGAYGDAQDQAIIVPIARDLGLEIVRRAHTNSGAGLASVDATELDQSSLLAACASGEIIKIESLLTKQELAVKGGASADMSNDFFADSVTDCGVPTFAWSSMLVANGEAMKKLAKRRYRIPSQLAHLTDVKRYPGKRALIRSPKRLLEMMLLGSGIGRNNVYEVLATRKGQDAAFELLDQLSEHILWVDGSREALLALDEGNVTIAMTFSGRAFRRLISSRLRPIWDGHIIDYASWAIPASSKNHENAKHFILAATSAESLAAQARIWPYGPMRRSAVALAKRHTLLDTQLDAFMPTSNIRFEQGLVLNAAFWAKHGVAMQDRFDDWLAGVPLGIRVPIPTKAPPPPPPPLPGRSE